MIDTIKNHIEYILDELWVIKNKEEMKDFRNEEQKLAGIDSASSDFVNYVKDFRPYRGMVDTLLKSYDVLNKMFDYSLFKYDSEFAEEFLNRLIIESKDLHILMKKCKSDYNQFRCLSDSYVKLADKINRIERDRPRDKQEEQLKKLDKAIEYEEDKINEKLKSLDSKQQTYYVEITDDSVFEAKILSEKYPDIFKYLHGVYISNNEPSNRLYITL